MFSVFSGYLAGLAVGAYCLGTCLPMFLPILLAQKRNTKTSFLLVLEFSLGRLLGYLLFGLIFGGLGQFIETNLIHSLVAVANVWAGVVMILFVLGTIDKKFCRVAVFKKVKWPLLLGFLTGVNICPPFLASLTHVFSLRGTFLAIIYFLMFFLGTSTYIVPAAFLGVFSKKNWVQKVAQASGVLMGLYFVVRSLINVF